MKLLHFFHKNTCNHIVGIQQKYREEEIIYHDEFIKIKKDWEGKIFWICPLCRKQIWSWVDKHDRKLGHIKIRKYIGGRV